MAGILDYKGRGPSWAPMAIDGAAPSLPAQRGGLFGMFQDDLGAIQGSDASGRSPLTGQQKQALIFSGISDAIDNLQGRGGNTTEGLSQQFQQDYTKQKAEQRRLAVNQALQAAYASGDMNQVRAALLKADPEDLGHIHDAMTMTQPKIQDVGGAGYSIDPFKGTATQVIAPRPKAPLISNGMQSTDNGTTWAPIPGYVGQQQLIAGARRAPPKPTAAGGFGGNPASLFGGH